MYKVLIVDDELIVRQAVKALIRWDEGGLVYAGSASGGKRALEMISATGADIVITDIKMPDMDGIELIKRMKAGGFDGETLVLSNYNDFELVREALKQGAYDYMLKLTLKSDDFMKVLGEMRLRLSERRSIGGEPIAEKEHRGKKTARDMLAAWNDQAAETAVSGAVEEPGGQRDGTSSRFVEEGVRVYLYLVRLPDEARERLRGVSFEESLETLASALFTGSAWTQAARAQELRYLLAVAYSSDAAAIDTREFAGRITGLAALYYGIAVRVVYSNPVTTEYGMAEELDRIRGAEPLFFYTASQEAAVLPNEPAASGGDEAYRAAEANLHDSPPEPHEAGIGRWVRAAYRLIGTAADCRLPPRLLKRALNGGIWSAANAPEWRELEGWDAVPWLERVETAVSEEELKRAISDMAARMAALIDGERPVSGHRPEVRKALRYLEAHYADRVSLTDVSAHVGLSEPYLCQLFKAETGRSIMAQLNEIRMAKAYELLASGKFLVKEAAYEVGIHDPFYFNRLFKKRFGISPKKIKQNV